MTPDRSGNARRLDKGGNALDLGTRSPVARLIVSFLGGVNPGVVTSGAAKSQCSDTEVYAPGTGDSPPLTAAAPAVRLSGAIPQSLPWRPFGPLHCLAPRFFVRGILASARSGNSKPSCPALQRKETQLATMPSVRLPSHSHSIGQPSPCGCQALRDVPLVAVAGSTSAVSLPMSTPALDWGRPGEETDSTSHLIFRTTAH